MTYWHIQIIYKVLYSEDLICKPNFLKPTKYSILTNLVPKLLRQTLVFRLFSIKRVLPNSYSVIKRNVPGLLTNLNSTLPISLKWCLCRTLSYIPDFKIG